MSDGFSRGGPFAHLDTGRESYYERRRREDAELAALRNIADVARRYYGNHADIADAIDRLDGVK